MHTCRLHMSNLHFGLFLDGEMKPELLIIHEAPSEFGGSSHLNKYSSSKRDTKPGMKLFNLI